SVPTGFGNGQRFQLRVLGVPLQSGGQPGIIYDNSSAAAFAQNVQDALDAAFGGMTTRADGSTVNNHVFNAVAVSTTAVDIAPGTGLTQTDINDDFFVPPTNAPVPNNATRGGVGGQPGAL